MSLMKEVYDVLSQNDFVETAEEFSTDWCWRSKNWYAVQKHKQSDFSITVAINCLNQLKIRIAMAHLRRKRLGTIADSDIKILSAIRDKVEQYLLNEHRIASIDESRQML